MTDPLSLLRQYNIEGKEIIEKNGQIIFGEYSFSPDVPTSFLECKYRSIVAPKKYYTLETVLFYLKHKSSRKKYVTEARNKDIPIVRRANRRKLLAYLNGKSTTCSNIDKAVSWKIPAQDAKLPIEATLPSFPQLGNVNEKEKFSSKAYSRCKSVSTNFLESDSVKASQQNETTIPVPAKFVESEGGCRKLLDGSYFFIKDKEIKNRTYWKCEFQVLFRCPARITTTDDCIESKWRSHDHWQSKSPSAVEAAEIKNETKMNSAGALNSEVRRENTENVNALNGTDVVTVKANAEDVNCSRALQSETTKEDTETNANIVESVRVTSSESENQDSQDASTLMMSVSKLFDEMSSKVVDGTKDFLEEEFSLIATIYSLFHRLMILRKFNDALDSVIKDLEVAHADDNSSDEVQSSAENVDLPIELSESDSIKVATPSKQLHSTAEIGSQLSEVSESDAADVSMAVGEDVKTDDSASESGESDDDGSDDVKLSEKITCVCEICDKPIDISPDSDIQVVMETHLYALHPFFVDPLDSASDSDKDYSSECDEKSEPPDDPMILLDGTKLEDFEVKFDRDNALKYVTHSNGIFLNKKNAYICHVCGSYMPLEKHLGFHLKSRAHREKIREYCQHSIEAKKNHVVSVNPDIFVIRRGKLYCVECQVYFLNPHAFLSHVSEQHEQKLKLDFPIVRVGTMDFCSLCDRRIRPGQALVHVDTKEHYTEYLKVTTVVQLKSIKFCSLCNVKLFTESQYNFHVNDDSHTSNLELIETIVSGLKLAKK